MLFSIHSATPSEFSEIGTLLVDVYRQLEGFPRPEEQPAYYAMLANVGALTERPGTEIIMARMPDNRIVGAVVFFSDMKHYGSGGTATQEKNAAGFRLLAVDPHTRGLGIGKALTLACIRKASVLGVDRIVIHTTRAMQPAWKMYEALGFERAGDLDFVQGTLPVYGFRYFFKNSVPSQKVVD